MLRHELKCRFKHLRNDQSNCLKSILICIAIFINYSANSQNFKHYNNYNGLENNHIKGIQMDSLGFTWIGTENGLIRYDGTQFTKYNLIDIIQDPINENRVVTLFPPENGWVIGVIQTGRTFRALGNKVEYHKYNPKKIHNALTNKDTNFEIVYYNYKDRFYLDHYRKHLIVLDSDNLIEIDTGNTNHISRLPQYPGVEKNTLHAMTLNFRFYYFANYNHCFEYYWPERKWKKISVKGIDETKVKDKSFTIISGFLSNQRYMVFGRQLYQLTFDENENTLIAKLLVKNLVEGIEINHVFYDEYRMLLFVGTNNSGLYIYHGIPDNHTFSLIKTNTTRGFIEFDNNSILNSYGQLVYTDRIRQPTRHNYNGLHFINGYMRDHWGQIWINCTDNLYISEKTFPLKPKLIQTGSNRINAVIEDKNKRIWLLLTDRLKICENNSKGRLGNEIASFNSIRHSVTFSDINPDEILIASEDGFLFVFDVNSLLYNAIILDKKCKNIRSVRRLNKNIFMITTYGFGMFLVSKSKSVLVSSEFCESLKYAHGGFEYIPGRLLITTNNGIVEVAIKDLIELFNDQNLTPNFTMIDGEMNLPALEFNGCNQSCIQKLSNGLLAAAGVDGITLIDPKKIKFLNPNMNFLMESIFVDGEEYKGDLNKIICKSSDPYIRLQYSIPFYSDRKNCIIEYKIEGQMENFQRLKYNSSRTLDLFGLGSGRHHLIFRYKNSKGGYDFKHFYIEIPEFWNNRWKEIVIFLIIFIMILIGFFYLRSSFLALQNKQLMALVDDRTKRLSENLLEIDLKKQQLEKTLLFKNRIMSVISHDVLGPLRFAAKITREISNKQTNMADKETLNGIGQTIERMLVMSFDILTWAKSQSDSFRALNIEINLFDIVERIFTLHEDNAKLKIQNMVNEIDDEFTIQSDPNIISAVLNNLIENAVKYGGPGNIIVDCRVENNTTYIEVSNTGPKFETELIDAINNSDSHKIFEIASRKSKGGHGLRICYELLMMLNGQLYIHRINEFNVVGIKIPQNGISDSPNQTERH